jgi:hypothetical protein
VRSLKKNCEEEYFSISFSYSPQKTEGTGVYTAYPKLKSKWPNLKRGEKFVGIGAVLYLLLHYRSEV